MGGQFGQLQQCRYHPKAYRRSLTGLGESLAGLFKLNGQNASSVVIHSLCGHLYGEREREILLILAVALDLGVFSQHQQ